MTHLARILCTLYAIAALWLAYCTVQTWGHAAPWASVLNAAASIAALLPIVRESVYVDGLRDLRVERERAARPPAPPKPVADPPVMSAEEQAAFAEIEANYRKDQAA